jgi:hypothetical protein
MGIYLSLGTSVVGLSEVMTGSSTHERQVRYEAVECLGCDMFFAGPIATSPTVGLRSPRHLTSISSQSWL